MFFQEHLLIVCELLKANLYEFHKFNRESGGEVYFTMPRLQVWMMLFAFHVIMLPQIVNVNSLNSCKCSQLPFKFWRHFNSCIALD